jgi:glutathione synthase
MKLAFVVDPLDRLKAYKDSSIAMMRAATARQHEIHVLEARDMLVLENSVRANTRRIEVSENDDDWFRVTSEGPARLADFDYVLMRKDPPFDQEYYYATLLLERVETEHRDVIVKKLDGMGGTMIFRVAAGDPNRNVIVETLTDMGRRTIMAQRYVPEITDGDKRVLVIDGEPFSHCLARIPKAGETRGNLAAGGTGVARPITARDREIGERVGRELVKAGIVFAGLDIIGDWLTEVNVTSPTCIVEIAEQAGEDAAEDLMDALGV